MTVAFDYGKLHQAMFGDRLGVWAWSKRKQQQLSNQNKRMSRWNHRCFCNYKYIFHSPRFWESSGQSLDKYFRRSQEKESTVFRTNRYVKYAYNKSVGAERPIKGSSESVVLSSLFDGCSWIHWRACKGMWWALSLFVGVPDEESFICKEPPIEWKISF